MSVELNLRFPKSDEVIISFEGDDSGTLSFQNPFSEKDHQDIRWYLETYGAHSLGDPDDKEGQRVAGELSLWGKALFNAVFREREAERLFNRFQDAEDVARLLTVSAEHPAILALPWELLHDSSAGGGFLFMENPRISVRRRISGAGGGRSPFRVKPKERLHLLFVVSRPEGSGFLDPRADPAAVLDALDKHAPGRVSCEFLRPPTLDALLERLENSNLPPVDVIHFDGHGVYDAKGGLPARAGTRQDTQAAGGAGGHLFRGTESEQPPGTGYLLFETNERQMDFISAERLGANLHRHKVGLVILSACQSATIDGAEEAERPMGSVAARLTGTGIPAVLAMTHSVLVPTTRALFGEFYKELARNKSVGEALDNARRWLFNHPEKYEVQREHGREWLKLYDWFLPALYQPGADVALLEKLDADAIQCAAAALPLSNLPARPEAGFFGRRRALWEIERCFAADTQRITLTGFGGQGKTALALEAGRWLLRAGLFQAAVFVDYSAIQTADAVGVAQNEIGSVLGQTFSQKSETLDALRATPTLIILDNLEALAPDALRALLDAAVPWSQAGGSRVLCTTRQPDFQHPGYKLEGTHFHRRLPLEGLGSLGSPDDALEWFARLQKLPPAPSVPTPAREALISLFEEVRFHPLSIRILAAQLKSRRPAEVGMRLGQLLADPKLDALASKNEDTPSGLLASLTLSLDRLDANARSVLPRLGVFQGGAFEDELLGITGLGGSGEREILEALLAAAESGDVRAILRAMGQPAEGELAPELVARITGDIPRATADLRQQLAALPPRTENLWPELRGQLEAAALIEAESVPDVGVPFLHFHPTLAPLLWSQLDAQEQAWLSAAHRRRYAALARYLHQQDFRTAQQARSIARRELPNLLHAVHAALDAAEPEAADFAGNVNRFLDYFGLWQEKENLLRKAHTAAGEVGSQAWYLAQSDHGEQMLAAGRVGEAMQVFRGILAQLGEKPAYLRAVTLGRLGRCFAAGGRPDLAARSQREGLALLDALEPTDSVKRARGVRLTDLADALSETGQYAEAREAYEAGLKIAEDFQDLRSQGVILGQLGTLALHEGNLNEAAERHRKALALFQRLEEPRMESTAWHQLGWVFQQAQQWEEAERHSREAARISEQQGDLARAASAWSQLAIVCRNAGKLEAAERWYRKAIGAHQPSSSPKTIASILHNLASLLSTQAGRLAEARELAEKALEIDKTLDPGAAQIWKSYSILAGIIESEAAGTNDATRKGGLLAEASAHRRLARETYRAFPGARTELRRSGPLILVAVAACAGSASAKENLAEHQAAMRLGVPDWIACANAFDRLMAGERDAEALCANLDFKPGALIECILAGIADPETLRDFMPAEAAALPKNTP